MDTLGVSVALCEAEDHWRPFSQSRLQRGTCGTSSLKKVKKSLAEANMVCRLIKFCEGIVGLKIQKIFRKNVDQIAEI